MHYTLNSNEDGYISYKIKFILALNNVKHLEKIFNKFLQSQREGDKQKKIRMQSDLWGHCTY